MSKNQRSPSLKRPSQRSLSLRRISPNRLPSLERGKGKRLLRHLLLVCLPSRIRRT
jgi:hypothetical protein